MIDLEILKSCDNYKIVGFYTRNHVDPKNLIDAALNYHSDPEWIECNISSEDVIQEYWKTNEWDDDDGDEYGELECFTKSNKDTGFPVTVFYLDDDYRVR